MRRTNLLGTAGFLALLAAPQLLGQGVTLFSGVSLQGENQTFRNDVYDMGDTPFGANRARSVDVAPGCVAWLYEERGFRGRSVHVREADNNLGNTILGRDSVGSIQVRCGGDGWDGGRQPGPPPDVQRRGVTLFRDRELKGPSQTFHRDVADLSRTPFGGRRASSIDLAPGCEATLYSETRFRGRSVTFREADNNLKNTRLGEDSAMSLRVECPGGVHRPEEPPFVVVPPRRTDDEDGPGATLYRDRDREGPSQKFTRDEPDLTRSIVGPRTASSIDVTRGCSATLYSEPNFRGRSTTFNEADNNLKNTKVGGDAAMSIQVRCR